MSATPLTALELARQIARAVLDVERAYPGLERADRVRLGTAAVFDTLRKNSAWFCGRRAAFDIVTANMPLKTPRRRRRQAATVPLGPAGSSSE